jgi:hypothetical protein
LALQSAGARLLARRAPDLALRISPHDAIASSARASVALNQGLTDPSQLAVARGHAARSLTRDMTRDDAFVVMAATMSGPQVEQRATRLVNHAERLSRRNLATQLWLIEDAVRRQSVVGALSHFDIALRTSKIAGASLYPVLRAAIEDPPLVEPIARTLNAAPWRGQFLQYAISLNQPSPALAAVVARQKKLLPFQGSDLRGALVGQLVSAKSLDAAARLALGRDAGPVQDPVFANAGGYAPFAWQLADGATLVARRLREGASTRLQIQADESASGVAASQAIRLAPGRYVLSAAMTNDAPGLSALLECLDDGRALAAMPIVMNKAMMVEVPTGCRYQTLKVMVSAEREGRGEWYLTRVDVSPN